MGKRPNTCSSVESPVVISSMATAKIPSLHRQCCDPHTKIRQAMQLRRDELKFFLSSCVHSHITSTSAICHSPDPLKSPSKIRVAMPSLAAVAQPWHLKTVSLEILETGNKYSSQEEVLPAFALAENVDLGLAVMIASESQTSWSLQIEGRP